MVAQHSDQLADLFDRFSENVQAVAETGRRSQESMFQAAGEAFRGQPNWMDSTKFADGAGPLMSGNIDAFANYFDTSLRSGVKVFKAVCDSPTKNDNSDWYGKTSSLWDAMFSANKASAEAFAKVGRATMENWSRFCGSACGAEAGNKTGAEASK